MWGSWGQRDERVVLLRSTLTVVGSMIAWMVRRVWGLGPALADRRHRGVAMFVAILGGWMLVFFVLWARVDLLNSLEAGNLMASHWGPLNLGMRRSWPRGERSRWPSLKEKPVGSGPRQEKRETTSDTSWATVLDTRRACGCLKKMPSQWRTTPSAGKNGRKIEGRRKTKMPERKQRSVPRERMAE